MVKNFKIRDKIIIPGENIPYIIEVITGNKLTLEGYPGTYNMDKFELLEPITWKNRYQK